MKRNYSGFIFLLACTLFVNACWQPVPKRENATWYALPDTSEFTHPPVALPLDGQNSVRFGIKSCVVFQYNPTHDNWSMLFKPEPYPLPQNCVRERVEFDGEYIQIEIGTQAIGAGGCCTTYAAYRSRDGQNWEIRPATSMQEWQALDSYRNSEKEK